MTAGDSVTANDRVFSLKGYALAWNMDMRIMYIMSSYVSPESSRDET